MGNAPEYTEWHDAQGYHWREKVSGFTCINNDNETGDFCDTCGDCVYCYGTDGWDGHLCRVIEYDG